MSDCVSVTVVSAIFDMRTDEQEGLVSLSVGQTK